MRLRGVPVGCAVLVVVGAAVCALRSTAFAAQLPSLFRGIVVANSPLGVRVVSAEETSQSYQADLRAEDIIVQIDGKDVRSIDEFAAVSSAMKGRAITAKVLVFRNGAPQELFLHLYSFPILRAWGIEFVPEHDLRFAQPEVGLAYWARLGNGFEKASKPVEALNAYLNGLHNMATDGAMALKASQLFSVMSEERLRAGRLAEGIASLRQELMILEKLFDYPLSDEQLQTIRQELVDALKALQAATARARQAPVEGLKPAA